eukprot:8393485-Pyramimonas_sp.AAC.1
MPRRGGGGGGHRALPRQWRGGGAGLQEAKDHRPLGESGGGSERRIGRRIRGRAGWGEGAAATWRRLRRAHLHGGGDSRHQQVRGGGVPPLTTRAMINWSQVDPQLSNPASAAELTGLPVTSLSSIPHLRGPWPPMT